MGKIKKLAVGLAMGMACAVMAAPAWAAGLGDTTTYYDETSGFYYFVQSGGDYEGCAFIIGAGKNAFDEYKNITIPSKINDYEVAVLLGYEDTSGNDKSFVMAAGDEAAEGEADWDDSGETGTLSIPSTLRYIDKTALNGAVISKFEVDSENETFGTDGTALWSLTDEEPDILIKLAANTNYGEEFFSNFSSISPTAFLSIADYMRYADILPEGLTKDVVFNFYSQDGMVFAVNGEAGFCCNSDKYIPEDVSDASYGTYGKNDTESDETNIAKIKAKIKALLYAGVPFDALGLYESTFGISYEEAMEDKTIRSYGDLAINLVGYIVWEIVDGYDFDIDNYLGKKEYAFGDVYTAETLKAYYEALEEVVENYEKYNFTLSFGIGEDNEITFRYDSETGMYISDEFTVDAKNAGDETDNTSYVYTVYVTTDGVSVYSIDGEKANGTSFKSGSTIRLVSETVPESVSFSYEERSLMAYVTDEDYQDILVSGTEVTTMSLETTIIANPLVISKMAVSGTEELPGASLTLTDSDGNTVESWTSGTEAHEITGLSDGTYTLTEVTAPDGYETAESITFTIEDGTVSGWDDNTVIMYDSPESTSDTDTEETTTLIISKQDITTGKELPGATLTLYINDEQLLVWVSTDEPYVIENPVDGNYVLTETTAPDGYDVTESISFTITGGMVSGNDSNTVVMYDSPTTTSYSSVSSETTTTTTTTSTTTTKKSSSSGSGGGSSSSTGKTAYVFSTTETTNDTVTEDTTTDTATEEILTPVIPDGIVDLPATGDTSAYGFFVGLAEFITGLFK